MAAMLSGMAKKLLPDDLWALIAPLIPPDPPRPIIRKADDPSRRAAGLACRGAGASACRPAKR